MQQVAGPFRGRAKSEQLFGIGVGILRMDQDLPEERRSPDPPNGGRPKPEQLFANSEVQTQLLPRLVRVVRFKKNKKDAFCC